MVWCFKQIVAEALGDRDSPDTDLWVASSMENKV